MVSTMTSGADEHNTTQDDPGIAQNRTCESMTQGESMTQERQTDSVHAQAIMNPKQVHSSSWSKCAAAFGAIFALFIPIFARQSGRFKDLAPQTDTWIAPRFQATYTGEDSSRVPAQDGCVLAIGDIHGDLQQAEVALRLVGAVDEDGLWSAGSCTLVQTGDIVDRGPDSLKCLQRFETLSTQAQNAGGRVITLLGNHELFSLQGVFNYVSSQELRTLGKDVAAAGEGHTIFDTVPAALRKAVSRYPPGILQLGAGKWAQLLGPNGWAGQLLRSRDAAAVVGAGDCRTLAIHAGLLPETLTLLQGGQGEGSPVDQLNAAVSAVLAECDGSVPCPPARSSSMVGWLLGGDGPFWVRDYAMQAEVALCSRLQNVLDAVGAKQAISGHTVQESGHVGTRCGGRLYLLDVGMSRSYSGGMGAWKCTNGKISVL